MAAVLLIMIAVLLLVGLCLRPFLPSSLLVELGAVILHADPTAVVAGGPGELEPALVRILFHETVAVTSISPPTPATVHVHAHFCDPTRLCVCSAPIALFPAPVASRSA